jgi:hypothetical protein
MAYHNKRNRFDKDLYDPMQLGATVKGITEGNGMIPDWFDAKDTEGWEDLLEFAKDAAEAKVAMPEDAPAKIKAAYDNYYAQKNKKSSTRDKVVAKVKKSRSK